jgi:molybdopterin molybdotransferase
VAGNPVRAACDVRMRGFADRVPVAQALRWIDNAARRLDAEEIAIGEAAGRVLALPLIARADLPPRDCAAIDGFAVHAADSLGASDYDPVVLKMAAPAGPIPPGSAAALIAGMALPAGADAVLPFELAQGNEKSVAVFAPIAEGAGILRRAQELRAGAGLFDRGRRMRPADLGLLAALGIERISAVCRPLVRLVVAGAKGGAPDADGPLLQSLVARDGGIVESLASGVAEEAALAAEIAAPGADIVLVAGRSGTGNDDVAPLALAGIGELAIHGIALRPGGSTGMGSVGAVPVILLPGEPLACLVAYELFAGRLIRLHGGRGAGFPHRVREAELDGKIAATVGIVEFRPVRIAGGRAEPMALPEAGGLAALREADGFVLVPAALEGYAVGTPVRVHLCGEEAQTS